MNRNKFLAVLSAIGILTVTNADRARAEVPADEVMVDVRIESTDSPTNALGILVSPGKTKQFTNPGVKRVSNTVLEVSFPVKREDIVDGTLATALVLTSAGEKVFSNMVPLSAGEGKDPLADMKECDPQDASRLTVSSQLGLLTQLYEVRKQRRDYSMEKMRELMTPDLLETLKQFEGILGLSRGVELSPDLPALELIDRLSRILNSMNITRLRREEIAKANQPTPTPLPLRVLED